MPFQVIYSNSVGCKRIDCPEEEKEPYCGAARVANIPGMRGKRNTAPCCDHILAALVTRAV